MILFTGRGRGISVQRGSLSRGGLCPEEVSVQRGSLSRGGLCPEGASVREIPLYGKERTVRILLECFLVLNIVTSFIVSEYLLDY